jgi:hypothetical protein
VNAHTRNGEKSQLGGVTQHFRKAEKSKTILNEAKRK